MGVLVLAVFGSLIVGVLGAVGWFAIRGRREALSGRNVRRVTLGVGAVGLAAYLCTVLLGASFLFPVSLAVPFQLINLSMQYRFLIPLLVGIALVAALAFPRPTRRSAGVAELSRRGVLRFSRGRWFIAPLVALGLTLLLTIPAGFASQPDEVTGNYTEYMIELGGGNSVATGIYGWFYSVPALIALAVLAVVTIGVLATIARPGLGLDPVEESRTRQLRSRNVLVAATAALSLHLAAILQSLAWTASLQGSFSSSIGTFSVWTPFAALEAVLNVGSYGAAALGAGLWAAVALSAVPARRTTPAPVPA